MKKNSLFVAHLRPQKQEIRIYFGLAAIYYMPCRAEQSRAIPRYCIVVVSNALNNTQTFAWPNKKTIRNETDFFLFKRERRWNQNCNKKVSGKRHSLAHSIAFFFQICVWIFRCTIATILSEHFPILKIALAWILKQNTTQNKRTHVISQQFHSSESVDSILLHKKRLRHQVPFANACYQLYAKCVE